MILPMLLLLAVVHPAFSASSETAVYIDPPSVTVCRSEEFYVNVSIMNVVDLYAWSIKLSWTPGILNCIKVDLSPPGIIRIVPLVIPPFIDNTDGYVIISGVLIDGWTGNFTLAWIRFNATAVGSSNLTFPLSDLTLLNSLDVPIPCNVSNGFVEVNEPEDDVAITNIDVFVNPYNYPSVAISGTYESYPKWLVPYKVNVTVKNEGNYIESFIVSAYLQNSTGNYTIGTQQVNNLAPGATTTLTFSFTVPKLPGYIYPGRDPAPEAWPYPTYTVWANASVVPGETDTADNQLFDGLIKVKWPGDVTGDGHVSLSDLVKLAKAWYGDVNGTAIERVKYNYVADFNMDGRVDLKDLIVLAPRWGRGPLDL